MGAGNWPKALKTCALSWDPGVRFRNGRQTRGGGEEGGVGTGAAKASDWGQPYGPSKTTRRVIVWPVVCSRMR
jgi:hypothetical protein